MFERIGEPHMIHCQFEKIAYPLTVAAGRHIIRMSRSLSTTVPHGKRLVLLTDGECYKRGITIICEFFSDEPVCAHLARLE